MATYRAIKGINIQSVSSDNATLQLGDVWYNSTLGKLRVGKTQAAAWASGGNLNQAAYGRRGAGTQTAALAIAGQSSPGQSPRIRGETETYDGSSWTEVADLNTDRYVGGSCGTQTAAFYVGGHDGSATTDNS